MANTPRSLLKNQILGPVALEFVKGTMKMIRAFSAWCRRYVSMLKKLKKKQVREWSMLSAGSFKLVAVVRDRGVSVQMPPLKVSCDGE